MPKQDNSVIDRIFTLFSPIKNKKERQNGRSQDKNLDFFFHINPKHKEIHSIFD